MVDSPHTGQYYDIFVTSCREPLEAVEQTVKFTVILDTMMLMWHHCNVITLGSVLLTISDIII